MGRRRNHLRACGAKAYGDFATDSAALLKSPRKAWFCSEIEKT